MAASDITVYKLVSLYEHRSNDIVIRKFIVPRGALIVVPIDQPSKFRTNALCYPGKDVVWSVFRRKAWTTGLHMEPDLNDNIHEDCGHPGLYACATRKQAKEWL